MTTCWYCDRRVDSKRPASKSDAELHEACDETISRNSNPDTLMERTRAAVGYLNGTGAREDSKMMAFLYLFHPEMPERRKAQIAGRKQ